MGQDTDDDFDDSGIHPDQQRSMGIPKMADRNMCKVTLIAIVFFHGLQ
jgi:hypothetical protein